MATSAYLDSFERLGAESSIYEEKTINRLQAEVSRVQKKTYTNWINIYLKPCNMEVTDLYTDLCDGKRLIKLMEVISNAKLGKPNKGVLRVQKIENVARALNYIKSKVHIENIGAEDIVDGNPTLILGLIWTIILRFQIEQVMLEMEPQYTGLQRSAKETLLLWCQNKTKGYPKVEIKDFSTSWRDGMAFGALIHSYQPTAIDMDRLRPDKPIENMTIAFKVAEECFEVPQMLDPQDVNVPKPDERSIMTYVSSMYQNLNRHRNRNKNANRVGKTINQAIELSSRIHSYEVSIRSLLEWIRMQTTTLQHAGRNLPTSLKTAEKSLAEFNQYRRVEKAQKYEERTKLEETLFTISLLTNELRAKPYAPTDPQLKLAAINSAWLNLDRTEHDYEKALREVYLRLEKLEQMVARFEHKAALREEWLTSMETLSNNLQKTPGSQVGAARKAEMLRLEIESKVPRFKELDELANEIARHRNYEKVESVLQLSARIQSRWANLSGNRMRTLLAQLAFPQTRADVREQLEVTTNKMHELEKQLTLPTKGEIEAQGTEDKTVPLEVIQAALDRHRIAEAEFMPLERKILQIRNTTETMWQNAPPMLDTASEKAGDFQRCQAALQLWNNVAERSRARKAKLEGINSSYSVSASLANELNWVNAKIEFLAQTAAQTKDPKNARDLQLAQRLCKKHQGLQGEVSAHEPLWDDVKRSAEQFVSTRLSGVGIDDSLEDTRQLIRSQVATVTSAWNHLQQEMKSRENALNECLESAQFYADADEASRWIQEKIHLIQSTGLLDRPLEGEHELEAAMTRCGPDSSSTMAQKRRLANLEAEMNAFQANDMQRLKYVSTLLRKPTDAKMLRPEFLTQKQEDDSSDIENVSEKVTMAHIPLTSKDVEGRAQALSRYTARDPAGRDIDVEKDEIVALIACTNADWWHVRRNMRGPRNEGFVPANRLRLLVAPVHKGQSNKADALLNVKREVSRGLSIRRKPSARTSNSLHFDKDNIQKVELKVNEEFAALQRCVKARDDCLQDTLAWHDFSTKCNNFESWMKQKSDQLQRDSKNIKAHGPSSAHIEVTIEEISKGAPMLAEIRELADILTGVVRPTERPIYKRGSGDLYYKKPATKRMKAIQSAWDDLNKKKSALEAQLTTSGGLDQFEKLAETMEILLSDRMIQLESMPTSAPNADASAELLRKVRVIKAEKPSLNEKMSRLRTMANSAMQNHPHESPGVKSRLRDIDGQWGRLQDLLKQRENIYSVAVIDLSIRDKVADMEGKLNDVEEQLATLEPYAEVTSKKSAFESLLPPGILRQRLRKAADLDDDLDVYDEAINEICEQAKRLPEQSRNDAEKLGLRNEELKRKLESKRDDLENAIKAQGFDAALDSIRDNIKEQEVRLHMMEPLASQTDVDREKNRVNKIKIELLKNITSITVNEERIEAAKLPKEFSEPLLVKSKRLRDTATQAVGQIEARDAELARVADHAKFHDDAGDLDEWIDEKRAEVVKIPAAAAVSSTFGVEDLRQIRGRIKKLRDIDDELTAAQNTLTEMQERSKRLPSCADAANFPDPKARVDELRRRHNEVRKSIGTKVNDLEQMERAAQFSSDADDLIKDFIVPTQSIAAVSAAPPGNLDGIPSERGKISMSSLPRNYTQAVTAINDAKRRRDKLKDDLAKLNALEQKAKAAGALTPQLAAQIKKEREKLQNQLGDVDGEIKQDEDLAAWYKVADEMDDLSNWADDKSNQLQKDLRHRRTIRATTQDHDAQRQSHARLVQEVNLREPRFKFLLDPQNHAIPQCLKGDAEAESVRPRMAQSWSNLGTNVQARSRQIDEMSRAIKLLGEISDMTNDIKTVAAHVDRLANADSDQNIDRMIKKLPEVEECIKTTGPDISEKEKEVNALVSSSTIQPFLVEPIKSSYASLKDAFGDLKFKLDAAKRSLFFRRRIASFDAKIDDEQQEITNVLAHLSAIEISEDPEQVDKLKNHWQVFIAELPQTVKRIDGCLEEGQALCNDLTLLLDPKSVAAIKTETKTDLGLTLNEMAEQEPCNYPYCNEQTVRSGTAQVRSQIDALARDKGLLQEQVRLLQNRIDHTGDISGFTQNWEDVMELIRNRNAHLDALNANTPKNLSTLTIQVKQHETLETELVGIQSKADEVTREGQELLSLFHTSKRPGGRRSSKSESIISDRIQRLVEAWKQLNTKMMERRQKLNQCSTYLQFCEELRGVHFWAEEAEQEISSIEPIAKTAAEAFKHIDQKPTNGSARDSPESIDVSRSEVLHAQYYRLSKELEERWKPLSMQLVAKAESMIDENHYAAGDLKNKVDQTVIMLRSIGDGLVTYQRWLMQLMDLLLLKKELMKLLSLTVVQRARLDAIIRESNSSSLKDARQAPCDKLVSSFDVTSTQKRVETVKKILDANEDKLTSIVNSSNLMIQKRHYASDVIHEVVSRIQNSRAELCDVLNGTMKSLDRRLEQVTWEEDAKEAQSWLTERENDLKSILKSPDRKVSLLSNGKSAAIGEDAVRTQLRILQRQDQVQSTIMGNKNHIEDILMRGAKLSELEEKMHGRGGSVLGNSITSRSRDISQRWKNLTDSLYSASAALNTSRDLVRYQNEADALDRWLREKDILLAKGDFGSDFDHCLALSEKINEPAAGKVVNSATIREFQDLSNRISKALRRTSVGGYNSVADLNKQTADYVENHTEDICYRWNRVQESLSRYEVQLKQAASLHETVTRVDGLLFQIEERKALAAVRDDLKKSLSVDDLEGLLRSLQANERDVTAIKDQTDIVKDEAGKMLRQFASEAANSWLTDRIKDKMNRLENTIEETRKLQKERHDLLESKLAAQRILESSHQLIEWADEVVAELKPHIVGTAMVGSVGRLTALKGGKSPSREVPDEEKRRAFIARLRRRLNDCQSELPLRRNQLSRLQTQAKNLGSKEVTKELTKADEALKKAEEVLKELEVQVTIEEKRQAFASAGKEEDQWLDSVKTQAQQVVRGAFRTLATDSDGSDDEIADQPLIVASKNGTQQYAMPTAEVAPQTCLAMLDALSSSLEDRSTLKNQFDDIQKYQSAKELYTPEKRKEDKALLDKTRTKTQETTQLIAQMRALVEARTECDNWFTSANESLQWMRDNQSLASAPYDWRVTLKRYGEVIPGSEKDQLCGPKGSGGMARKIAANRRFLLDIDVGLEMVDRLCERGEELAKSIPKKAAKVRSTVQELRQASKQLRGACDERTRRLAEANDLVRWGQLLDEAADTSKQTERQLMSDDYNRGENGLNRLLESTEVIAKDVSETQKTRVESLLKTATEAQKKGHFAGPQMVSEAQELFETVTKTMPQLIQARLDAIKLMIEWRCLEKELRVEIAWLNEQIKSPLLDINSASMRNLDRASATRQLKSLSELASCLAAQSPKIEAMVDGVNKLTDNSGRARSLLNDLGTLQEASRSANQLMTEKSELESRIGAVGKYLVMEHMYLEYMEEIHEANEWVQVKMTPVSKLAPATDSSGTKAAFQTVSRLRGDVSAFQRNTIGPLSARIQQREVSVSEYSDEFSIPEERTKSIVGDDLWKFIQKYPSNMEPLQQRDMQGTLNREMAMLMKNFDQLSAYLELVELRLKLRIGMNAYNIQGDEFNKFLASFEGDINSKNYGVDLEECEALLSKFIERLESTSNSGTSQLTNLTKRAQQLTENADELMDRMDSEEQRLKKTQCLRMEGDVSVLRELQYIRSGVQMDMKSVQERQIELTQKWAATRTGMKRRKENLQSALQIHMYMSDVDDLLEWIAEKSPEARDKQNGLVLLRRGSSVKARKHETNLQNASSLEKALNEQEKLKREVGAMQKQVDKQESECKRLKQDFPERAAEIDAQWSRLQKGWTALQAAVEAERQRLSEAQRVTEWTSRCDLLRGWADERRLAMLAILEVPTELNAAQNLLDLHRQIRSQVNKRTPEKEDVIRSGQELSNVIPSSKIVINNSIDRLETAWSQMLLTWTNRNGLYEQNLDLRKLLAEMAELDAWLDSQEERLEQTASVISAKSSLTSVEAAITKHRDIEKAIEDAQARFEAIKRQTLVETLKFEMMKIMNKRSETSSVHDQPFSSARVAEIHRRETSRLNRNKSKRVASGVSPGETQNQENLRAIFGQLVPEERPSEPLVRQIHVPTILETPSVTTGGDSFGMTNAQFERSTSGSSDIDTPPVEKRTTVSTKLQSRPLLRSPSQRSSSKFIDFFRRNSSSHASANESPNESPRNPVNPTGGRFNFGEKTAKLFSRVKMHSTEVEDANTVPSSSPTNSEKVKPPPAASIPPPTAKKQIKPKPLNMENRNGSGAAKEKKEIKPVSSPKTSNTSVSTRTPHENDWHMGDLATSPVDVVQRNLDSHFPPTPTNGKSTPSVTLRNKTESTPETSRHSLTGSLARKVHTAPRSYRGITKKWLPAEGFNWAVLEGPKLSIYENEGAPTIGSPALAIYNVHSSVVTHCPPKTSKTHANVIQLTLEDGTEMLLAANTVENINRWYSHLKTASKLSPSENTLVRGYGTLNRSSTSSRNSLLGFHGTWTLPRSSSLRRRESDESGKHISWGRFTRRSKKNATPKSP